MRRSPHRIAVYVWSALVAVFLLAPTLIVIPMSFTKGNALEFPPKGFSLQWYRTLLDSPTWRDAAWTSAQIAVLTVVLATVLGTAAALALVRWRSRATGAVTALLLSPMIVPVIILGVGTFLLFSRWHLAGTMTGLVIAHTVLAIPFVIVSVMASARTLDPTLELAAASLGANRWKTFLRVTLPLILPGVVAGALFAFITSWDEIVVAIFMTSPTMRTLPVLIWSQVRTTLDPSLAAAGTLLVAVSTLALVAVQVLQRLRRA
jgi:putative spermidine/putrescine transport system permease protein